MLCRESGTGKGSAADIAGLSEDELITQTVENFVFDLLEMYIHQIVCACVRIHNTCQCMCACVFVSVCIMFVSARKL